MTQEEKELLLRDLCARLPYGVFVKDRNRSTPIKCDFECHPNLYDLENTKPYLRPMSSMTEEENTLADADYSYNKLTYGIDYAIVYYVDYLYSIHVDCHGLIPKGLALEAPEDMYK